MHTPLRPLIHIRQFSTIQPKPLDWLWQPRIPRGKITLLAGDPASGKTTLLLHLASLLSRNHPMPLTPLETRNPKLETPAATLLLSPEDNLADTLRPKLDSLGADLSHIHTLPELHSLSDPTHIIHPETQQPLSPLEYLEAAIESIPNLALLIIDPITYYLGLTDKSIQYRSAAQSTRPRSTLHALSALAEKYNLALLLTTRLAKKLPEKDATLLSLRRSLGSLSFTSTSRSVLLLHNDHTLPNRRLLITIKSNLADPPPHLAFNLTDKITWEESPATLPADAPRPKKPTRHELNENTLVADAVEFLQKILADGPQKAASVQEGASELGISVPSLRRARIHLQTPSKYSRHRKAWFLSLPGDSRPIPTNRDEMEKDMRTFEESHGFFSKLKQ